MFELTKRQMLAGCVLVIIGTYAVVFAYIGAAWDAAMFRAEISPAVVEAAEAVGVDDLESCGCIDFDLKFIDQEAGR